ncbi:MAG: hypothetical protein U5P41_07930 [Gammaproteobacteria bacterium]|nr:hypothetical protein [Gammaproteobacteria bacterium]
MQRLIIITISLILAATGAQAAGGPLPRLETDAVIATDGYRLPLSKWLPDGEALPGHARPARFQ